MAYLSGLPELRAAFTRLSAGADATALSIVTKAAANVEAKAKANFEGAHRRGEPHVGPSPGPPNIVTGTLRRSITHDRISRTGPYSYGTRVGPTTIYARRVELGGTDSRGRTTRPFPYFEPAVRAAQAEFAGLVTAEWARFVHG